jgi:predicted DNA-binding protein
MANQRAKNKIAFHAWLSLEQKAAMRSLAASKGLTMTQLIHEIADEYIEYVESEQAKAKKKHRPDPFLPR